jgi:uncharacterized protein (TIGR03083 family)
MDPAGQDLDYLAYIRAESDRFRDVLRDTGPDTVVPSCPDWTAQDLLWHLTEVQWFWATIVEQRRTDPDGLDRPDRPASHQELLDLAAAQAARLHDVLAAAEPATEVYMWSNDRTVGYIRRRQAHEALIHRLDAELTADHVTGLDAALAADGVREIFEHMYGGCPPWGTFAPDGTLVHVRLTDTGHVVPVQPGRFTGTDPDTGEAYDEEVAELAGDPDGRPDLVVMGSAEDVDTWLWHRRDAAGVTFEGDPDVRARLQAVLDQPLT